MFRVSWVLTLTALLLIAAGSQAQDKGKGGNKKGEEEGRRCAYLGQWGSFHLIGTGGSAAYFLGNDQFIADLRSTGEDANFWYFQPSNGDRVTTGWAFSRIPDGCGMYLVWRHDGSSWLIFERVRAWGIGLGSSGSVRTTSVSLDERVESLESRMKKVEEKVKLNQQTSPQ